MAFFSSLSSRPRSRSAIRFIRRCRLAWWLIRSPKSTRMPVSYEYIVPASWDPGHFGALVIPQGVCEDGITYALPWRAGT